MEDNSNSIPGMESLLVEAGKLGVIIAQALEQGMSPNKIAAINKATNHMIMSTSVTDEILSFAVNQINERNKTE